MSEETKNTPGPDESLAGAKGVGRPKWLIPTIAGVCVVALVAGGVAAYRVHEDNAFKAAQTACNEASDGLRTRVNEWNALVNGDAATASEVSKDKVMDAKVLDTLKSELDAKTPAAAYCTADSRAELDEAAKTIDANADWYKTHTSSLQKAVDAVNKSVDAKTLKDAQDALKKKVDEARKLLDSSKDKVQDDKTRDALSKLINQAGKDVKDAKTAGELKSKLETAMKTVNDSMTAKKKADEEAKAKAEAEAAAQAQQSYTPSYQYSGSGYGYSNGNGYTGGGNTSGGTSQGGGTATKPKKEFGYSNGTDDYDPNLAGTICPESVCGV
ncbi:hypothetical protein [Bifidobacterium aerophilum]|uniref:Colicin transporter n=1 Tax=Bifidobacterium aerophilum TaxID=1798155 RepID=A0A6N9Z988_9BIFI|nr:hypothetical protein [Bifidobacterium aerophilum]NEG90645.1 hypothetical protein [Bifidobacterium aerophilum]